MTCEEPEECSDSNSCQMLMLLMKATRDYFNEIDGDGQNPQ